MTRGGTDKRIMDVRVRLTGDEWDRWQAFRAASGRKELGAWVRAVVNEITTGIPDHTRRPGDLDRVPEVNQAAAAQLAGIANNVNQLARWANTEQRALDAVALAGLVAEVEAAIDAVRGRRRRRTPAGTAPSDPGRAGTGGGGPVGVAAAGDAPSPAPPDAPASASSGRPEPAIPAPGDSVESRPGSRWRRVFGGTR